MVLGFRQSNSPKTAFLGGGNRSSNHDYWAGINSEPWLIHGVQEIDGLIRLGGRVPVEYDRELIGAVGVSGRSTMAWDLAIATVEAKHFLAILGQS